MLSLDSELVRAGIRLFCCILGEIHRGPGARPSLLYPCAERRRIPPSPAVPLMRIGTQILIIIEKLASNFLVIVKIFYRMKATKIKRSHFAGGDLTPPLTKGDAAPFGNPIILCPPQEAGLT